MPNTATAALLPTRLGDRLLERGLVNENQLAACLAEQRVTGDKLGTILLREGLVTRPQLESVLGIKLSKLAQDATAVPPHVLLATNTRVVGVEQDRAIIQTRSPRSLITRLLSHYFTDKRIELVPYSEEDMDDWLETLQQHGAGNVLDQIIQEAFRLGASDIHLVPRAKSYSLMMRQLGVRKYIREGPLEEYLVLAARIKDKAGMDIAERRVPQDGAWRYEVDKDLVLDLRVATIPSLAGETVVIRVLDQTSTSMSLDTMGITRIESWRNGFTRADGLCLVCGPTGSGKTSLLNATVRELDYFGRAVYSAEDPVEYRLPFVSQVNVNSMTGLTFARAVQAFMRADPDVILIGEIRDADTARNAIRAAETGHMVLATLHTESITGAYRRLTDLGVEDFNLRALLRAVVAQRLVRTVCPACRGKGCTACHGAGYSGRTAVSECAEFDSEATVAAMMAGSVWWPSMLDDAWGKVEQGITTPEEIVRVFGRFAGSKNPHAGDADA